MILVNERKTGQSSSETHWVLKASLVDSRTSVNDVKFAPRHLGLMLVGKEFVCCYSNDCTTIGSLFI